MGPGDLSSYILNDPILDPQQQVEGREKSYFMPA